jgi:hypothetical protein
VLAVIIFILVCFALDVAPQANFFQSVLALKGFATANPSTFNGYINLKTKYFAPLNNIHFLS